MARVQEKERGWGQSLPVWGHRLPLKMVHAAFGGSRGDESFCPWPDRAFQFLGEVELAGGKGLSFVLTPHQLRPVRYSLAGAHAPGTCGFVHSFW